MHVIRRKDLIYLINSGICKINGEKEMLATITRDGNKIIAVIKKEDLPKDECYLDFCPDFLISGKDAEGYSIASRGTKEGGAMITYFTDRADAEYISDSNQLPIFGFKTSNESIFAVVTGMTYEYKIVVGVKDGT